MAEKIAFVFDTNFIIRNKKLDKVLEKIEEIGGFVPYIAQFAIEERKAQQRRELRSVYEKIDDFEQSHNDLFRVQYLLTLDEAEKHQDERVQNVYNEFFPGRIIPFDKSEETLDIILNRANEKTPPFCDDKNASDKGFKDCILWLSLINFFKSNGESKVLFITDDNAFLKKKVFLEEEFYEVTERTIDIQPYSYYEKIGVEKEKIKENKQDEPLSQNIKQLRERINETVDRICFEYYINEFGEEDWNRTFTTSKLFDKEYIKVVLEDLQKIKNDHIFEETLLPSNILDLDGRISNRVGISMDYIESLINLYKEIKDYYSDYIVQFCEAVAKILNRNYVMPVPEYEDDELPF